MNVIEWIGTILAVWVFIKFILMSVNPKGFIKWGSNLASKDNKVLKNLYLVLFFVLAYYLLQEIDVVQFFVAIIAGMILMAHTFMHYPKVMKNYLKQFKGKNPNAKIIFDWLIWLLLAGWVLKEIFF